MRDEKMMILSMLEEGKITSEEAVKLLEALEESENFIEYEYIEDVEEKFIDLDKTKEKVAELEKLFKEKGEKVESFGVDLGNKLSNMLNNLVSKGSSISFLGDYKVINTEVEKDISHLINPIIQLKSINGGITVKNWEKDKLLIKVNYHYKNKNTVKDDKFYKLYEEDNKLIFEPIYTSNVMIKLDVYLPNRYYEKMDLKTTNGKIQIDDFNLGILSCKTSNASISLKDMVGKDMDLSTKNGRITLKDISSPMIKATTTNSNIIMENIDSNSLMAITKNGKIAFSDILADNITGNTSNGSIEINYIDSKVVELNTSNGKIICKDLNNKKIRELKLSTSNSTIDVELGDINKMGYFNLETSLGNISLEIPNLIYEVNKQVNLGVKKIVAHSVDFDKKGAHFILNAFTSNGSITIR